MKKLCFALLLFGLMPAAFADDDILTVAVASNFQSVAQLISTKFTQQSGEPVRISAGATGMLYAQIVNGAPYDVFLAADAERPRLLEEAGLALQGSRFTYAVGALALWSADTKFKHSDCREVLMQRGFRKLAIANPATAPYGFAAKEVLLALQLYDSVSDRLVLGENVAQTMHFVVTRNATLGLVSAAQLAGELPFETACVWHVPLDLHTPLQQQGVVLARSKMPSVAAEFMSFLRSPDVAAILQSHGYTIPE